MEQIERRLRIYKEATEKFTDITKAVEELKSLAKEANTCYANFQKQKTKPTAENLESVKAKLCQQLAGHRRKFLETRPLIDAWNEATRTLDGLPGGDC